MYTIFTKPNSSTMYMMLLLGIAYSLSLLDLDLFSSSLVPLLALWGDGSSSDSDSGSNSGECGQCGDSSTTFLQKVYDNGEVETLNDVMVGNPSSLFYNKRVGEKAFQAGLVGHDLYAVPVDGSSEKKFRLKEIEFEDSEVFEMSYASLHVPTGSDICTDHTHQSLYSVASYRLLENEPIHSNQQKGAVPILSNIATLPEDKQPFTKSWQIDPGETIEFTVEKNADATTFLFIGAFWRPLASAHADAVQLSATKVSAYASPFVRLALAPLFYLVSLLAPLTMSTIGTDDGERELLRSSYQVQKAQASYTTGKSLYMYYQNQAGEWTEFAVIHPRFALSQRLVCPLPEEAFSESDTVSVRISSNCRHYIYGLGVAEGVDKMEVHELTPINGVLNGATAFDFSNETRLSTKPGDTFDFSVTPEAEATHIVFKLHGYYVPRVTGDKQSYNEWKNSLSLEEKQVIGL